MVFFCNSCDVHLESRSKNRHLLTRKHIMNSKKIPYDTPDNDFPLGYGEPSEYPSYPDMYRCTKCNDTEKENFYEYNTSRCKSCKNKQNKEIRDKKTNGF